MIKHYLIIILIISIVFKTQSQSFNEKTLDDITIKVSDLLEYQQECYNDSTKYCYYTVCDWGCVDYPCNCNVANLDSIRVEDFSVDTFHMEVINPCHQKYLHKEPTFEGFINWINIWSATKKHRTSHLTYYDLAMDSASIGTGSYCIIIGNDHKKIHEDMSWFVNWDSPTLIKCPCIRLLLKTYEPKVGTTMDTKSGRIELLKNINKCTHTCGL